jgi:hypothetical protein
VIFVEGVGDRLAVRTQTFRCYQAGRESDRTVGNAAVVVVRAPGDIQVSMLDRRFRPVVIAASQIILVDGFRLRLADERLIVDDIDGEGVRRRVAVGIRCRVIEGQRQRVLAIAGSMI